MTNPTLITTPFAENGDKNVIPESVGVEPQNATMQVGFPPITQQKISEGGIPPERNDFNGMFNLVTQHLVHLNKGLPYEFDQSFANAIGGYPLNARLMLDNGDIVRSTVANNTNNPNNDMTGWVKKESISTVNSIYDLPSTANDGDVIFVKGYYPLNASIQTHIGGGVRIYSSSRSSENDGFLCINGWVLQVIGNTVSFTQAGAKPNDNSFDSSDIINSVLATGLNVYDDPNHTYYVSKPILTKGQSIDGGFKITSSLDSVRTVTCSNEPVFKSKSNTYIYCGTTADYVDFMHIKSLGVDTILHYFQFKDGREWEKNYTQRDVLDSIKSSGLSVIVSTFEWVVKPDFPTWMNTALSYDNVVGFYTVDEPVGNNVSIAKQIEFAEAVREYTNLPICCAESQHNTYGNGVDNLAKVYDIIFFDSYYQHASVVSGLDPLEYTKLYYNAHLGIIRTQNPHAEVIPAIGAYISTSHTPSNADLEKLCSFNIDSSRTSDKVCSFIYDAFPESSDIKTCVKISTLLQNNVRDCNNTSRVNLTTDISFGTNSIGPYSSVDYGLSKIIDKWVYISPFPDVQTKMDGAYITTVVGSPTQTDTDFSFKTDSWDYKYSGICVKAGTSLVLTTLDFNVANIVSMYCRVYEGSTATGKVSLCETKNSGRELTVLQTHTFGDASQLSFPRIKGTGGKLAFLFEDVVFSENPTRPQITFRLFGSMSNW
ncbi:tail spike protein [Acinetobacter phage vB_AbaM_AB3P2]|nr:tail spike protein [Acinetobacter phage vB_AbaM_AB3P2]